MTTPSPPGSTWTPSASYLDRSRLLDFCAEVGVAGRAGLDQYARENPAAFWDRLQAWLGFRWQQQPEAMFDQLDDPARTRWFIGGVANIYDSAVTRWIADGRGEAPAVLGQDRSGSAQVMTFAGLDQRARGLAAGLAEAGVRFGDRVGVQLPASVEAVVTQLALARLGAICVPIFSGFGVRAVADRLNHAGATCLVVADGVARRGRVLALREQTREVLSVATQVCVCVTVPCEGVDPGTRPLPGELAWTDVEAVTDDRRHPTCPCPTTHPLMIAYTSGTTGAPKGVAVGHAGFGVKAGGDAALLFDLGPGDVACWVTDPGWVMWPIALLGGLLAGASVAIFDGTADYPHPRRLWEFADQLGVTMLGVSPTVVRTLIELDGGASEPLRSLRVLGSSGEPLTADVFEWLHDRVGHRQVPIINYSGGTEVSGGILANTVTEPIRPGRFAGPVPGMGASVVDERGHPRRRGVGELALDLPSPGMPLCFWGEPDRCASTYWGDWHRRWRHGDWVEITDDGDYLVHGRTDDVLTVAGKRIGPAEVESVVNESPAVVESAAVGVPDEVKGEAVVVFARVDRALTDTECVRAEIVDNVARQLGKPLTPRHVLFVDDLPRTASGKILRRVVRGVHLSPDLEAPPSVANPLSLTAVRNPR